MVISWELLQVMVLILYIYIYIYVALLWSLDNMTHVNNHTLIFAKTRSPFNSTTATTVPKQLL